MFAVRIVASLTGVLKDLGGSVPKLEDGSVRRTNCPSDNIGAVWRSPVDILTSRQIPEYVWKSLQFSLDFLKLLAVSPSALFSCKLISQIEVTPRMLHLHPERSSSRPRLARVGEDKLGLEMVVSRFGTP
jgi:hypothetical protein